jgi:hypothetical protein
LALPLALAASLLLRPDVRSTFGDRHEEEQVGGVLRRLGARNVALDTDDFGFFAVQAALGDGKSHPLDDRDPRKPAEPPASTTTALASRLGRDGAEWLVTPRSRGKLAAPLGHLRLTTPRFNVVELEPRLLEAAR